MGVINTTPETAQEFYNRWHERLIEGKQNAIAKNLSNVKDACNEIESVGGKISPASVGKWCQAPSRKIPPAENTIRNPQVEVEGQNIHIYKTYIEKRAAEAKGLATRASKQSEGGVEPLTFMELASRIQDSDTRQWVKDLAQRFSMSEKTCDTLAEQLEHLSRSLGGLDLTEAIEMGPSSDAPMALPMLPPSEIPTIKLSDDLATALKKIVSLPDNDDAPYILLDHKRALIWDSGTGAVRLLSPKEWAAIVAVAKGGQS